MEVKELVSTLEDIENSLYSKDTISSLVAKDISEYDRGVIQGKIELLTKLKLLLKKDKK